jgi:hypothetical protein
MINICEKKDNQYVKSDIQYNKKVLEYLKKYDEYSVSAHEVVDQYTNRNTGVTSSVYTDGNYWWRTEDIYHFEKYNVKLRPDFVCQVLNSI